MTTSARTDFILHMLALAEREQVATGILGAFKATSFEECVEKYDRASQADRKNYDQAVERVIATADADFWDGVRKQNVPIATPPRRR